MPDLLRPWPRRLLRSLLLSLIVGTLTLPLSARAQTTLQLDMIVFEQPSWVSRRDHGQWPLQAQDMNDARTPEDLASRPGLEFLPDSGSAFAAEAAQMRSQGYTPLYVASYRFPQSGLNRSPIWRVASGPEIAIEAESLMQAAQVSGEGVDFDRPTEREPETRRRLQGWARAWVDTYLFVEMDIARLVTDAALRAEIEQQRDFDGERADRAAEYSNVFARPDRATPADDLWPREALSMHRLAQRKRVKLNEVHYFDHPVIGILMRVTQTRSTAN
ncbi:MAG: CsiV family protein [Oceanococcaceae bacterium]